MKIKLGLPERPFRAIQNGTKKAEGRVQTQWEKVKLSKLKKGDFILFTNEDSGEEMNTKVTFVHHYPNPRKMLEAEGAENMLSSGSSLEEGVRIYNSFEGYAKSIPKEGIYAIGIKPQKILVGNLRLRP